MNENTGNHKTSANHVSPAPGEVEIVKPRQGIWRSYDVTDGLPTGIQRMLQDRRGYLWLTAFYGIEPVVCRYDGAEFTMYTSDDGLAKGGIGSVLEDSQGRLWFGTQGSGVSCFDGQRFITYTAEDGLVDNHVWANCEDSQGRLWFGTLSGVSCFDGQRFINYTTDDGLANSDVRAICEDSRGRLWFGTFGGGVFCFDGQRFINYTTDDGLANSDVRAICEDSQGRLWFGVLDGGVFRFDGRHLVTCDIEGLTGDKSVATICEDRQGRLWFGSFGCGAFCFDGQRFIKYTTEDGLLDNRVWDIFQDREGHFWICQHQSGLTHLDLETMQILTTGSASDALIQDSEGRLWFSSENDLCCLFREQQRRRAFGSMVSRLMQDSTGALWMGTFMDGLYCYDPPDAVWSGEGKHFRAEDGLGSNEICGLLEARDGTIWVGTKYPGCLCRFNPACGVHGKAFEAIPTPHPVIFRLLEDSRGRIWVGGWEGGGLSCYDGEKLVTYTMADGLPSDVVLSIVEDDDGNLWIGTFQDLCCFDGKGFITYGKEQGLFSRVHYSSAKDVTGQLWFGTRGGGVYRYDGEHFQWLTAEDGLPGSTVTGLIPQPDGSMIIGTPGGIVHYHPTANLPPPVEIREVVADQIYRNIMELELTTTDARLLTISYHGLSFATRRMRYSYILQGCDKEWQDTWDSQVRYENLPVGEYTFRVIAINRDLVPSEAPATLKLKVISDPRDLRVSELESDLRARSQQLAFLQREMGRKYHFENIVGDSDAMEWVRAMMERAIDSGLNVLITGETGTGKELVAKAIHYSSPRKGHPLLDRNCGAIPKELLASDLFGHRRGAFTGAQEDKVGLFEAASGGTLLLDEISEMPLDAQIHLLRVLEERKVQRLGENVSRNVDVRIIAMTNKDLMEEGKAGRFREDLYYRLSEFPIPIPPLQERKEDIPLLAEHFLQEYSQEQKKELNGFEPGVLEMLQSYSWPGNVRELRNDVRRAAALVEEGESIHIHHFPPRIIQEILPLQEAMQTIGQKSKRYRELVDDFERRCIEHALRVCAGNRSQAAKMLGLGRKSLYEKMQRLGIG